jgi:hypoxanthine phosphoribosyltransferase
MSEHITPELLYTEIEISEAVAKLADALAPQYLESTQQENLVVVTILVGAFLFSSDLQAGLHARGVHTQNKFVRARSYGSAKESNRRPTFEWQSPAATLRGRDILVVDDLIDEGYTLEALTALLWQVGVESQRVAVLLQKEKKAQQISAPISVALRMPDVWVYGYGIDSGGEKRGERNLMAEVKNEDERMLVSQFGSRSR